MPEQSISNFFRVLGVTQPFGTAEDKVHRSTSLSDQRRWVDGRRTKYSLCSTASPCFVAVNVCPFFSHWTHRLTHALHLCYCLDLDGLLWQFPQPSMYSKHPQAVCSVIEDDHVIFEEKKKQEQVECSLISTAYSQQEGKEMNSLILLNWQVRMKNCAGVSYGQRMLLFEMLYCLLHWSTNMGLVK